MTDTAPVSQAVACSGFQEGQTLKYHYSGVGRYWDVTFLRMSKTGKKAKVRHMGGPSYWKGSTTYVDPKNLEAYK